MVIRRLNRIFRPDGKVLIVAMDHGLIDGACKGLENPGKTISSIVAGGADAILTSYGVARRFASEFGRTGLILRADGLGTSLGKPGSESAWYSRIEDALRLGADAMAVSAFPGSEGEVKSLEGVADIVREAHAWGVVVLAEMVPGGFDSAPEYRTVESIALSARVGVELGADIIKAPYAVNYSMVTKGCFAPVVILGGAKRGNERAMLEDIKNAIGTGAAGVAIGRNIFQAENPGAMTRAVAAIIHEGVSVDEAVSLIEGK